MAAYNRPGNRSGRDSPDLGLPGKVYARLGSVYGWASPDYVRERMTEPMVHGYLQQMNYALEQAAAPGTYALLEGFSELVMAFFKRS